FDSYSFQEIYKSTLGQSFRGCKIGGFTINANIREYATISLDWMCKDVCISTNSGGSSTWTDGSASPVLVTPIPSLGSLPDSFKFYQGVMALGGTPAMGTGSYTGEIQINSATPRVDFDQISVQFAFNLGGDAYGVNLGDRTRQTIPEGIREITIN